jgi:hypothetical protein
MNFLQVVKEIVRISVGQGSVGDNTEAINVIVPTPACHPGQSTDGLRPDAEYPPGASFL